MSPSGRSKLSKVKSNMPARSVIEEPATDRFLGHGAEWIGPRRSPVLRQAGRGSLRRTPRARPKVRQLQFINLAPFCESRLEWAATRTLYLPRQSAIANAIRVEKSATRRPIGRRFVTPEACRRLSEGSSESASATPGMRAHLAGTPRGRAGTPTPRCISGTALRCAHRWMDFPGVLPPATFLSPSG